MVLSVSLPRGHPLAVSGRAVCPGRPKVWGVWGRRSWGIVSAGSGSGGHRLPSRQAAVCLARTGWLSPGRIPFRAPSLHLRAARLGPLWSLGASPLRLPLLPLGPKRQPQRWTPSHSPELCPRRAGPGCTTRSCRGGSPSRLPSVRRLSPQRPLTAHCGHHPSLPSLLYRRALGVSRVFLGTC